MTAFICPDCGYKVQKEELDIDDVFGVRSSKTHIAVDKKTGDVTGFVEYLGKYPAIVIVCTNGERVVAKSADLPSDIYYLRDLLCCFKKALDAALEFDREVGR